jgi:RNA polymerase sigma-70 factor (ECF subfamily)
MGEPKPASWPGLLDAAAGARQMLYRVGRGDRDAFQAFYVNYGARVLAMVRRQVAVPQLAEELVQDVFVAVWLGARGYREDMGDPERWLLGITRHKLQDHWRRVRGLVEAMGSHAVQAQLEARMPNADLRLAVEEALAGLPVEQRRVLDLIYQRGLTFSETARALGVPRGTVKSRVHAALLALRALFRRSSAP